MAIKLFLLLNLIFLTACGNSGRKSTPVLIKGQVTSGMPEEYQTKIGLITGLMRHDLFLDHDGDGRLDRDDSDIDGDGAPNDCDEAPFDMSIGSEDRDADHIPDFCDDDSELQDEIYERFGIILNRNESFDTFNEYELKKSLEFISTKTPLPHQALKTFTLTSSLPWGELGLYDQDWENIRFKPDMSSHEEFPEIKLASWTLIHELFHFVAAAQKELYQSFLVTYDQELKNKTIAYPTQYSQTSPEEYFAEDQTLNYFHPSY